MPNKLESTDSVITQCALCTHLFVYITQKQLLSLYTSKQALQVKLLILFSDPAYLCLHIRN